MKVAVEIDFLNNKKTKFSKPDEIYLTNFLLVILISPSRIILAYLSTNFFVPSSGSL